MYLVRITSGIYEDYYEENVFVTDNEDVANNWVNKFNRIIDANRDRIKSLTINQLQQIGFPFWYNKIKHDNPIAETEEIQVRS